MKTHKVCCVSIRPRFKGTYGGEETGFILIYLCRHEDLSMAFFFLNANTGRVFHLLNITPFAICVHFSHVTLISGNACTSTLQH